MRGELGLVVRSATLAENWISVGGGSSGGGGSVDIVLPQIGLSLVN